LGLKSPKGNGSGGVNVTFVVKDIHSKKKELEQNGVAVGPIKN